MKFTLPLVAVIAAIFILSSCGSGGDSISEVRLIPVKSGKEFQYIDQEGKIVINPQFRKASVFIDGLALVQTSGDESKFGFITEDGKYAINAQYLEATVFSDGLAWVVLESSAPSAIDDKGDLKFTLQDSEQVRVFKNGLAAFSMVTEEGEEKWGFVNKEGQVVINPQFSSVLNFNEDKCGVRNSEGKWGFIDKEGKIYINYQFDRVNDFKNGKCVVTSANKNGVIDKDGKYIINPQFSEMKIDGDMFLVELNGKWGWCDREGKLIINPQFRFAYPFNGNEIAAVRTGKSYGYIDKEGKMVINAQFDYALSFNGKLALVENGNQYGFIDKEGKYVINPQFDDFSKDFQQYVKTGGSEFSTVNTDYFNVGAITSSLDFDSPEAFTGETALLNDRKDHKDFTLKYNFNGSRKPDNYTYSISLSGKGYGKNEVVISAILRKLSGYTKDEDRSTEDTYFYSDSKKEIKLFEKRGKIRLEITSIIAEVVESP